MKKFVKYTIHSFPVQLLLLHFRKSQILLFFWLVLFLTINGHFMHLFGADGLFLSPEYMGKVSAAGSLIMGITAGVFIMSWNITTFIEHSARFRFLAATKNPFLKYCLNNSIIPVVFLIIYGIDAYFYQTRNELIPLLKFLLLIFSFACGLFLLFFVSFVYFFSADKQIVRTIQPGLINFDQEEEDASVPAIEKYQPFGLPVNYYASNPFKFRRARDVSHYSQLFLDSIFKRHHFSAMVVMLMAFIIMVFIGFFLDKPFFQIPAGASIFLMFALLTAVIGALRYFLRSWGVLFLAFLYIVLNLLYTYDFIDPRNKAYGLNYDTKESPAYTLKSLENLDTPDKITRDKENMLSILNKWKARQGEDKPLMVFMNFSGGGLRGAAFSMDALQKLDSATHGKIMRQTFMMSGASGGMLAAAYFRELYRRKESGANINPLDKKYVKNISEDLLNSVFSSWVARDIIAPTQKFTYNGHSYIKDRGYAFERKLNQNTEGVLNHNIEFYKKNESDAKIPLMIFNSVVTRDLKKMVISTQPVSFMMQSEYRDNTSAMSGPDAIDFGALFKNQSPHQVSMLSLLRMNATYPYVLPAVWLPTNPVIDVMDAGLRDNIGQETSLRFINVFKDWINENTRGVVIIQIRSRVKGSWDGSFKGNSFADVVTRPFEMLLSNWFTLQDYFQEDEITYAQSFLHDPLQRISFTYVPPKEQNGVALNFHLTANEKKKVNQAMDSENNLQAFRLVMEALKSVPEGKSDSTLKAK